MPFKYKYTASTKYLQGQGHLPMVLNWNILNICYLFSVYSEIYVHFMPVYCSDIFISYIHISP